MIPRSQLRDEAPRSRGLKAKKTINKWGGGGGGLILRVMHHYCIIKMSTERQKKAIRANGDRMEAEDRRE